MLIMNTMIGIIEYVKSTHSSSNYSVGCVERKRRQSIEAGGMIVVTKLRPHSNPPKWHLSLKQHFDNITTKECKKPVPLADVTQLLVDSGFVSSIDVSNLSQTCKQLYRTTMKRQSIWKSLCMQDFPSGTRQMPPAIVKEKGYKWLYRKWKSCTHSSESCRKRAKTYSPLPAPRLSADQIMVCVHLNGRDERPLHKIPIVIMGNALSPLLNDGRMTFSFPEPVLVPITNGDGDGDCNGKSESSSTGTGSHHIHVRVHFLSISDASMCCIYNETKSLPMKRSDVVVHHRAAQAVTGETDRLNGAQKSCSRSKIDASEGSPMATDLTFQQRNEIDASPFDATRHSCDVRLRNSPTAAEIKRRLLCDNALLFQVGLCLADESINQDDQIHANQTAENSFVTVVGLNIELLKFDRTQNLCSTYDSEQMEEKNGGVTILHYLSELNLS